MSNSHNPINDLPNNVKGYLNNKIDLFSLFLVKKLGQVLPRIVLGFIIAFTVLFFTLFFSYSFIEWYADYVGKSSTAALIVSGAYLLISILIYTFRNQILYKPIQKGILGGFDFKDINKASSIDKIHSFEQIDYELSKLATKSEKEDEMLNKNFEDIKEFYSFDSVKSRFIDEIFHNPKPALSLIMQSIMSISSLRKKYKENKEKKQDVE